MAPLGGVGWLGIEVRYQRGEQRVGRSCVNGCRETRVQRGMNYVRAGTNLRPVRVITG